MPSHSLPVRRLEMNGSGAGGMAITHPSLTEKQHDITAFEDAQTHDRIARMKEVIADLEEKNKK